MNKKELDKVSKSIEKIFKKNKWVWYVSEKVKIPNCEDIKETLIMLMQQSKKSKNWVSTGRLRVEYYQGYDILIEGGEFHIDE